MIQWRLKEVMSTAGIKANQLAEAMGISATAMSALRRSEMPRINGAKLNSLLLALNGLSLSQFSIGPSDLIRISFTAKEIEKMNAMAGVQVDSLGQSK